MKGKSFILSNSAWEMTINSLWDKYRCIRKDLGEDYLLYFILTIQMVVNAYAIISSSILLAAVVRLRNFWYGLMHKWTILCIAFGLFALFCNGGAQLCMILKQSQNTYLRISDSSLNRISRAMCTGQFIRNWGFIFSAAMEMFISLPFIDYKWTRKAMKIFWVVVALLILCTIIFCSSFDYHLEFIQCHGQTTVNLAVPIRRHPHLKALLINNVLVYFLPALLILVFKFIMLKSVLALSARDRGISCRISFLNSQTRMTYFLSASLIAIGLTDMTYELYSMNHKITIHFWTWFVFKPIYDGIILSVYVSLLSQEEAIEIAIKAQLSHHTQPENVIWYFQRMNNFHKSRVCCIFSPREPERLVVLK